jgi:hypothetical protein
MPAPGPGRGIRPARAITPRIMLWYLTRMTDRIVHVVVGDSAAGSLALAELPGDIVTYRDALDRGPVALVPDTEHYRTRGAYFAARGFANAEAELAADDRALDDAASADELVLWFAHGLCEQLALVRVVARLARRGLPRPPTIVSIDRHPERALFLGLGELTPTQLAELWPRRAPLARDAVDEAIAAWIAVTAADPRALPLLARRTKALPFLAGAIERHLEELPDPQSGLARSERQILAALARGETDAAVLANVHGIDPRYVLTDTILRDTIATLAACGFVEGASRAVTPLGRQALAAAIDRVHECGIDDWRGGVRLVGRGTVWRWDPRARTLIER